MFLIAVVGIHAGEGAADVQNSPPFPGVRCGMSADPEQELPGSNTAPRLLFPYGWLYSPWNCLGLSPCHISIVTARGAFLGGVCAVQ